MIWQFGELGYDISIDQNGRTGKKPVLWDYFQDTARVNNVYKIYKAMLGLRKEHPVFSSGDISMAVNGATKRINLSDNNLNVTVIGNFDVVSAFVNPNFQKSGTWYEFFTGTTINVTAPTQQLVLQPGEYRLYTDRYITPLVNPGTSTNEKLKEEETKISIYPNPVKNILFIGSDESGGDVEIFNFKGQSIAKERLKGKSIAFPIENLAPGIYFVKIVKKDKVYSTKFIKEN
jgi:hypothetical protein